MDLPDIVAPDAAARRSAVARYAELAVPTGALGRLAELGVWLAAAQGVCPPRPPARARVVVVAGDHGIAEAGVSAHPAGTTARQVRALRDNTAPVTVLAPVAGASVRLVDVALAAGDDADPDADPDAANGPDDGAAGAAVDGRANGTADDPAMRYRIRRGSGRIDREDALTRPEVERAFAVGTALADEEVDAGADLLVPASLGVGATTPASVLVAALTGAEPVAVIGRGSGIDDRGWMRKAAAVRDALRRARPHLREPLELLRVAGGADLAVLTGFCVQAAVRRTPVLLDGLVVGAAALVADELAPGARAWWLVAQRSPEPAMALVCEHLALTPLLDLGVHLGDGTGAVAVVPLLAMAARLVAETAVAVDLEPV